MRGAKGQNVNFAELLLQSADKCAKIYDNTQIKIGRIIICIMDVKQGIRQLDKNTKAKLLTGKASWESAECRQIGLDSVIL